MLKGKRLRDLVVLDRYIADSEARLKECEARNATAGSDGGSAVALRQSIHALRARREAIAGVLGKSRPR